MTSMHKSFLLLNSSILPKLAYALSAQQGSSTEPVTAEVGRYLVNGEGVGQVRLSVPTGMVPGKYGNNPDALYTSRLPAHSQTAANVLDLLPFACRTSHQTSHHMLCLGKDWCTKREADQQTVKQPIRKHLQHSYEVQADSCVLICSSENEDHLLGDKGAND